MTRNYHGRLCIQTKKKWLTGKSNTAKISINGANACWKTQRTAVLPRSLIKCCSRADYTRIRLDNLPNVSTAADKCMGNDVDEYCRSTHHRSNKQWEEEIFFKKHGAVVSAPNLEGPAVWKCPYRRLHLSPHFIWVFFPLSVSRSITKESDEEIVSPSPSRKLSPYNNETEIGLSVPFHCGIN